MNEFWQVVLGSAVISTIISNICLWWHRKCDYKRDYYKKIIDKRIFAYEKLSALVVEITLRGDVDIDGKRNSYSIYRVLENRNTAYLINQKITKVARDRVYYSFKADKLITEINDKIVEYIQQVEKEYAGGETYQADCLEWGRVISLEILEKVNNLKSTIADDMIKMDSVEDFLKNKIK